MRIILFILSLTLLIPRLKAEVVLSNLDASSEVSLPMFGAAYMSFSAAQARLDSISIVMAPESGSPTAPLTVSIYSYDTAQEFDIGTKLITLSPDNQSPFSSSEQTLTYTSPAPFIFAANTNYVLAIESSDVSSYNVTFANNDPTAAPGWTYNPGDYGLASTGGVVWGGSMPFQINATAVPEPSAWILLGLGFGGILIFRRRLAWR